jgi:hypothetical protein
MGWMNYNMDVVHELGSLVHNLNIFNVAVTDAKQVAHQVSCTIHLGRKGDVYEGTSACIMAASRYTSLSRHFTILHILFHLFVWSLYDVKVLYRFTCGTFTTYYVTPFLRNSVS